MPQTTGSGNTKSNGKSANVREVVAGSQADATVASTNIIAGDSFGYFFLIGSLHIVVQGTALPHYICNQFCKWKSSQVKEHGKVSLSVKPCDDAYR